MEVTRPRGERKRSRDGVSGRILQPCYIIQRTRLLLPSDPWKLRRSSDLWGDPEKAPARKWWPDARRQGERPGSTIGICWWWRAHECQVYSMPVQRKAKAAHYSVPRSSSHCSEESIAITVQWWSKSFCDISHAQVFVDMVASYHAQELPLIFEACHWHLICNFTDCPFPF